jgi:hypothetical protein
MLSFRLSNLVLKMAAKFTTYSGGKASFTENDVSFVEPFTGKTWKMEMPYKIWLGGYECDHWERNLGSTYKAGAAILIQKEKECFLLESAVFKFTVEEEIFDFGTPIFGGVVVPYLITDDKRYDLNNFTRFPTKYVKEYFVRDKPYEGPEEDIPFEQLIL